MKKRKEDLKELILYTIFGNMTFIISIGAYAVFNVALGINELIANAFAWVFAVLFSYITNKKWVFRADHRYAKDVHAYVSRNEGTYKDDFIKIYNGKCAYCGTSIRINPKSMFEIDHFIPQSAACFAKKADAGEINNLVLSCRICNHNKSDFLMKAENQNLLHPDCEGIRNAFFRDEMYYIRVADGQPSEVKDFYRKLGLDRQSCRLDYLLLNMKGLYEKTTDRQDVHDLLGKAILLLYEKRNNCC